MFKELSQRNKEAEGNNRGLSPIICDCLRGEIGTPPARGHVEFAIYSLCLVA
jgi:hypothetical protein